MVSHSKNRNPSPPKPKMPAKTLEKLEMETLAKVSRTLSTIENAISLFDASEEKPEELKQRVSKLRIFHEKLSRWEKEMLVARTRNDTGKRFEMLEKFVDVCYGY